jgi:hypothetical protein
MLKLIPVVEFEPTFFQVNRHEIPDGFGDEYSQANDCHWKNSLADSGIRGIAPYWQGSWFVEISQLTPEIVEILLNKRYEYGIESTEFSALAGGYILEEGTTSLAIPQCCGSLIDIKDWEYASDWIYKDETMIWIGHPWLMVSSIDSQYLQIRETYENREPEEADIFTVSRNELKSAIIDTKKQLENFKQVLSIAVAKICPHLAENAIEIAEQLIYA